MNEISKDIILSGKVNIAKEIDPFIYGEST